MERPNETLLAAPDRRRLRDPSREGVACDGMKSDTSEKGLEALIVSDMTGRAAAPVGGGFSEEPEPFIGLHNWLLGDPKAYDRAWTVDLAHLRAFVAATQPPLL